MRSAPPVLRERLVRPDPLAPRELRVPLERKDLRVCRERPAPTVSRAQPVKQGRKGTRVRKARRVSPVHKGPLEPLERQVLQVLQVPPESREPQAQLDLLVHRVVARLVRRGQLVPRV